jgi:hypothetical protein
MQQDSVHADADDLAAENGRLPVTSVSNNVIASSARPASSAKRNRRR